MHKFKLWQAKCLKKRHSHFLQTQTVHKSSFQWNNFSKKQGWARRAHASAKRLPPFFGKTFYWKELLCTICVCKKWEWRFLKHLAVLTLWICACLSIFSLQKDWIRIFWTFIDSKKVNPCFFLLARSSATNVSVYRFWVWKRWSSSCLSLF